MLQGLQALRAFAAILVVIQHSVYHAGLITDQKLVWFYELNLGGVGVYIFFCLSGFVMALSSHTSARDFAFHRLFRIYPAYIAAMTISFAVFTWLSDGALPDLTFDASLLLLPSGNLNSSFAVPYWTLIFELFFYAFITVLLALRVPAIVRVWIMVAWTGIIVISYALVTIQNSIAPAWYDIALSPLNIFFATGYILSTAIQDHDGRPAATLLIIVGAATLFYAFELRYFLACAVMCAGAIYLLASTRAPAFLVRLGDWSYGIYLLHLLPIYVMTLLRVGEGYPLPVIAAGYFVVGLAIATTFGAAENWVYRRWIRPQKRKIT